MAQLGASPFGLCKVHAKHSSVRAGDTASQGEQFPKFRTIAVPEYLHLQQYRCENLKCRNSTLMSVRNPSCVKRSVALQ